MDDLNIVGKTKKGRIYPFKIKQTLSEQKTGMNKL